MGEIKNTLTCNDYQPVETEKLLFWMGSSSDFYYCCGNCNKEEQCKGQKKDTSLA